MTRMSLLERAFSEFRNELGVQFEHLRVNKPVLCIVVKSYFDDVHRHKTYHGSQRIDEVKQAGFTIKWIAKLRPIQFDCTDTETTKELLYINEIFSLRCGLMFMNLSPQEIPMDVYADLLYTLHYRYIDERMLFVWLATLRHTLDGSTKNQPSAT